MDPVPVCEKCNTPLDAKGACVSCRAESDGLVILIRSGYGAVREMVEMLETSELDAEMEQVPARRPEEKVRPLWNLYVPKDQAPDAVGLLRNDWAELLENPEAAAAAERGAKGVDLDAGGEIECPACGHKFVASAASAECPECGLSLGAPSDASPEEAE